MVNHRISVYQNRRRTEHFNILSIKLAKTFNNRYSAYHQMELIENQYRWSSTENVRCKSLNSKHILWAIYSLSTNNYTKNWCDKNQALTRLWGLFNRKESIVWIYNIYIHKSHCKMAGPFIFIWSSIIHFNTIINFGFLSICYACVWYSYAGWRFFSALLLVLLLLISGFWIYN